MYHYGAFFIKKNEGLNAPQKFLIGYVVTPPVKSKICSLPSFACAHFSRNGGVLEILNSSLNRTSFQNRISGFSTPPVVRFTELRRTSRLRPSEFPFNY